MNKEAIIAIANLDTKQFFFTTDHCQRHNLGSEWVPTTIYVPMKVVARESLPDGVIKDKEDYKKVFCDDLEEIKNPQAEYQA